MPTAGAKVLTVFAVAFAAFFFLAPRAQADIIEVEAATSCPGSFTNGSTSRRLPRFLLRRHPGH
jgi:hypothetical protein